MSVDASASQPVPTTAPAVAPDDVAWVRDSHREHVITSWTTQGAEPLVVTKGQGCWFWDEHGRAYLDFQSQLVNLNLGFQHPRVVEAIRQQAEDLCYVGPSMANPARSRLAQMLAEVTPGSLNRTFFTTSGTEANENAFRLARHLTGRHKIIARYRSYHGATAGALTVTGDPRRWGTEPGLPGVVRVLDPYTYRCPAGHPSPCPVCEGAPHLEEVLAYENPETVAAVVMETVTGTNGILVPPDPYLPAIREVCDRHGILLILDEVMVGCGRTGRWFACEHWDVTPDILTLAKGLNSGYVPLGAMVVSEEIGRWLDVNRFPGGGTYSGHPLACASAVGALEAIQEEGLVEHAAAQGAALRRHLEDLAAAHPSIGEVRGLGLFFGLEMVRDRDTREPLVPFNARGEAAAPMQRLLRAAMDAGLNLSAFSNVVRLAPPLVISKEELEHGVAILDEVLAVADEHVRT